MITTSASMHDYVYTVLHTFGLVVIVYYFNYIIETFIIILYRSLCNLSID